MSHCLGKIHCKTLEFELEIDFDSLWQGYCTSPHFFFNTYSQGAPQIVKTEVVVKLRHTLRHSTCVSMSFGIIEPHKILGVICLGNLLASDQFHLHPIFNRTLETMFLDQCLFLLIKLSLQLYPSLSHENSLQSKPLRLGRPSDSGRPPLYCSALECKSHGGQVC